MTERTTALWAVYGYFLQYENPATAKNILGRRKIHKIGVESA